jgi:peptidase M48-like protein
MPKKIKSIALFVALLAIVSFPVLADRTNLRPAWILFTPQQDIEMGRFLMGDAERSFQLVTASDANAYLDALGKQLTAHAPGDRYPYEFKIVDDGAVNAWALPGGFIYVTSGLMETAQNEQQLAAALAHEIGHVVLRHGSANVSQAYSGRNANLNRGRASIGDAMSSLNIRFGSGSVPLRYTPEQERQADVMATQILYDANFDPRVLTQMFQRIGNDRSSRTSEFLNDHPDISNREATVRTELRNIGPLSRNLRGDSPDFHTIQEHLFAANYNDRSYSRGDRGGYYSPDFPSSRTLLYRGRDIEFRYPDNWRVSDQGDSISIAPEGGFATGSLAYGMTIATFDARGGRFYPRNSFAVPGNRADNTTLASATDQLVEYLQQSNPNMRIVRSNEHRRVDGLQAMVMELTNNSPVGGTESDWLVTVLQPNGLLRYFIGVSPQRDFNRYQPAFDEVVASARLLE